MNALNLERAMQLWLPTAIFAVFYSNLPNYLFETGKLPWAPLTWFIVAVCLTLPHFFWQREWWVLRWLPPGIFWWGYCFLLVTLLGVFSSLQTLESFSPLRYKIRYNVLEVAFLFFIYFLMSQSPASLKWIRTAVLAVVLLSVFNNIYEFFVPYTFIGPDNPLSIPGRSAGFYLNSNIAAAALVVGMIFSMSLLRTGLRTLFAFLVLLGVVATFSRAGIMGWMLVVAILILTRVIPFRSFIRHGVVLLVLAGATQSVLYHKIYQSGAIVNDNIQDRLLFFKGGAHNDDSEKERLYIAEVGWQRVTQHPLVGNGTGSAEELANSPPYVSTHNTYLYYMVDYGVFGVFLYPLLILVTVWRARGEARSLATAFAAFVTFWGMFSHNIIAEFWFITMFGLMGRMVMQSMIRPVGACDKAF